MKLLKNTSLKIKFIAAVNGIAAVLHFVFWTLVLLRLGTNQGMDKTDLIVTYGLGIADLLWSVPFLIIGSFSLLKHQPLGWLAAQMANALYWYSFTFILFREYHTSIRPGTILFLPFVLFSIWSAGFLWKVKWIFFPSTSIPN